MVANRTFKIKELTEKEFVEGLKAAKLDIKTAADCLTDVMQYLTLTDSQGHDKECRQSCYTIAGVRDLLQTLQGKSKSDK